MVHTNRGKISHEIHCNVQLAQIRRKQRQLASRRRLRCSSASQRLPPRKCAVLNIALQGSSGISDHGADVRSTVAKVRPVIQLRELGQGEGEGRHVPTHEASGANLHA